MYCDEGGAEFFWDAHHIRKNVRGRVPKSVFQLVVGSKLYIPSTLNIDLILWHTQLIVCGENIKSLFKSWVFPFTFQAYIMPHTLNCMCVKGQLISKCLFEKIVWTKIAPKNLIDSALKYCRAESIKFFGGILVQTIFSKRHFEIN